ncbi:MAG: hypothetical protein A6F71_06315 [Cycloclasticus sp. symbiont of Poecilosclerida sp. M]|nr:MAG: hypothetical protein A6F71_06315 [Cycloclasticus sp. symbiont of Poecilosclerida sp. M]
MIKNTSKLALAATVALLVGACSEATRSPDWYIQHTHAQANKFTECQQKPELKESPNCIAAVEAEVVISKGNEAIKAYLDEKGLKREL